MNADISTNLSLFIVLCSIFVVGRKQLPIGEPSLQNFLRVGVILRISFLLWRSWRQVSHGDHFETPENLPRVLFTEHLCIYVLSPL